MTRPDIDAIEARAAKAMDGPWVAPCSTVRRVITPRGRIIADTHGGNDAAFIASARTDVPALCAYVRGVEAALVETENMHDYSMHDLEAERAAREAAEDALRSVRQILNDVYVGVDEATERRLCSDAIDLIDGALAAKVTP